MLQKLTAWMLALLIASPMCWCGWMHSAQAAAVVATKPSCCHEKKGATDKKSGPVDNSDCPCAHTPKVRDLASSKAIVPTAPVTDDVLGTWNPVEFELAHSGIEIAPLYYFHAHGPPLRTVPLFVRHCALLI